MVVKRYSPTDGRQGRVCRVVSWDAAWVPVADDDDDVYFRLGGGSGVYGRSGRTRTTSPRRDGTWTKNPWRFNNTTQRIVLQGGGGGGRGQSCRDRFRVAFGLELMTEVDDESESSQ